MTYQQAIDYLYQQAPMFQNQGKKAYKSGLETSHLLDASFGHPHRNYRTIHVAGTNGKGSTSHLIAAVLQCAGYRVGLYTSPHLVDFRERIRVNGEMISEQTVARFIEESLSLIEQYQPSFFEITTAIALRYFADEKVDVAIIEVGLGGRLDCTNIITPELAIITNISLDHTDILGDSMQAIAQEKAGVIKEQRPIVIGQTQEGVASIFIAEAKRKQAPIFFADQLQKGRIMPPSALKGSYQDMNRATVLTAIEQLQKQGWIIPQKAIAEGFLQVVSLTGIQGRWQQLGENPRIICDTGHNADGLKQVIEQLITEPFDALHIVFGMVNDKKIEPVLDLLPKNAHYYFTQAQIPRALDAQELHDRAILFGLTGDVYTTVKEALSAAKQKATTDDLIFIGGSNFIVGEII